MFRLVLCPWLCCSNLSIHKWFLPDHASKPNIWMQVNLMPFWVNFEPYPVVSCGMIFHQVFENAVRPAGLAASGSDGRDSQECNVLNDNPIQPVDESSWRWESPIKKHKVVGQRVPSMGTKTFFLRARCGKSKLNLLGIVRAYGMESTEILGIGSYFWNDS